MFGIGKKKLSLSAAVIAYIYHTNEVFRGTSEDWVKSFMGSACDFGGVPEETLLDVFDMKRALQLYFAGLLALDAMAVRNVFDEKTALAVYELLPENVKELTGDHGEAIAEATVKLLERATIELKDASNAPHDSIAFGIMEQLGLYEREDTKKLFKNRDFVGLISIAFLKPGGNWWKALSEKVRIVD